MVEATEIVLAHFMVFPRSERSTKTDHMSIRLADNSWVLKDPRLDAVKKPSMT